jgi:hypothetical protein
VKPASWGLLHFWRCDMPLTKKGKKVKRAMTSQYGKEKGERVFYASQNKGTIKGVEKKKRGKK